jgi:hypothetical protein
METHGAAWIQVAVEKTMCESPPFWAELEVAAADLAQQLKCRQIAFSDEQPPPGLFEHLVTQPICTCS